MLKCLPLLQLKFICTVVSHPLLIYASSAYGRSADGYEFMRVTVKLFKG